MIGYKEEKEWKDLLDRIAVDIMRLFSRLELADYISGLLEFRYPSKTSESVRLLRETWFEEYEEDEDTCKHGRTRASYCADCDGAAGVEES